MGCVVTGAAACRGKLTADKADEAVLDKGGGAVRFTCNGIPTTGVVTGKLGLVVLATAGGVATRVADAELFNGINRVLGMIC